MRTIFMGVVLFLATSVLTGCRTVYNTDHAPSDKLAKEGTVVFVRPDRYTVLGTRSVRDYIEITYEKAGKNDAGLLKVELGIRNRGGQHLSNKQGPTVQLSVRTAFYKDKITGQGPTSAPVYETNWHLVTLNRGETEQFEALCLVPSGEYYQVTMSEELGL